MRILNNHEIKKIMYSKMKKKKKITNHELNKHIFTF